MSWTNNPRVLARIKRQKTRQAKYDVGRFYTLSCRATVDMWSDWHKWCRLRGTTSHAEILRFVTEILAEEDAFHHFS